MKYCKHCGKEIQETAKFCNHCGKSLVDHMPSDKEKPVDANKENIATNAQTSSTETEDEPQEERVTPAQEKKAVPAKQKPKSKGLKFGLIGAAIIFILLIGTYFVGKSATSASKLLKNFEIAIEENDVETLSSMLTVNHKELELTDESIEAFIQLFESKPSELTYLMNHLKSQINTDYVSPVGMSPVDVIKDGKAFIFFDNYTFSLNPVYIKVATNYKDTNIIINGEVLATSDSDNFNEDVGPLIPGEYVVEAVLDTGVFHLQEEEKVQAMDPGFSQYVNLHLDGQDVSFNLSTNRYNDLKSIILHINGKETEYNIAKNDRVGPLLIDGSMNVSFEAELPWGTVRTNDLPIEDRYMDFNLGDSEEFKESIMDIIVSFNNQYLEAFTDANPDAMTVVTDQIVESIMEDIIHNIYVETEYEAIFHGVDFYTESFILKQDYDGNWTTTVDTITYFEEGFFEEGEKPKLEKIEEERRYELVYDKKSSEWIVYDLGYSGTMEKDKMKRYAEEEPLVYTSDWAKLAKEIEKELEEGLAKD